MKTSTMSKKPKEQIGMVVLEEYVGSGGTTCQGEISKEGTGGANGAALIEGIGENSQEVVVGGAESASRGGEGYKGGGGDKVHQRD